MKPITVIGFLGTQLDSGRGAGRWSKWRPSVAITQHEDMVVARMELLYTRSHVDLARLVQKDIATVSPETEVHLVELPIRDPWDFEEVYGALYDWTSSYPFDSDQAQYWLNITTGTHVAQICLFLLAESRAIPGVILQASPPKRQIDGAAGNYALIDLDLSRYDALATRHAQAQQDAVAFLKSHIPTRNPRFNQLIAEIEQVAGRSQAPMLLVGSTGAGKSFLARRMYELKKARHQISGAFVEVNCATLRGDSAASTLFGHKKGAFTGAAAERAGLLRTADQGLLFLDEIGELGADEQAMLLMAIEEKRFYPMGSDKEVSSDFQLIAGTNRDLRLEVSAGRFREDLFARINLWTYNLPGLAQRSEDIEPNIDHLLVQHAQQTHRTERFNAEARKRYLQFAQSPQALWSGNFRDLHASVTRLATLSTSGRITEDQVEAEIGRLQWLWQRPDAVAASSDVSADVALEALLPGDALAAMDLFDRMQLAAVVGVCRASGSLSEAGRQLFQASRAQRAVVNDADRLRKYLQKFGLNWDVVCSAR
ncbi:RNA repair transcriptional activator RtcR [Comamonas sp. B-9]|uniref:RNA repair transcriptional activator RtcR n=1 Tax=Comamonas sp. B-9 TaxID=1055192 RepID=UPI0003955C30|nr:RNA repair transcriptional activator RtcR [Comamonas sp. B-9]